ncbi:MAG TPA: TonB-dependent receptor [Opitutaceae bacterium]|nr:TonB-dependent receptor [Opitutaceae bacterium]
MKCFPPCRSAFVALLAFAPLTFAQKQPATGTDETIELPAFEIRSEKDTGYVGKSAISTTRTGVDLADLPQSVQVLTRNFIDDVNPTMLGDMLKFVGGAQTGNLNFSVDRFMLRGFTGEGDYQDGFRSSQTETQADMSTVERLEIIKGPSAIFVANGPVGGVINKISKSPTSYDVRTVKVQAGLFDANRAEIDLGGPITKDKRLMYRLVAAGQYSDGWYDRTYLHRFLVAPSLAFEFNPQTKLTLRYQYVKTTFSSYNGIPVDLRTDNKLPGLDRQVSVIDVPPESHFGEDAPLNWRYDEVSKFIGEFTTRPSDLLAIRLALLYSDNDANRVESTLAAIPATYTGGPLPRSTSAIYNQWPRRTLQNDYVWTFKTGSVGHKLLTGFEITDNTTFNETYAGSSSAIDPFNPVFPGTVTVNYAAGPTSRTRTLNEFGKVFALETASFANDRVLASVGASRNIVRTQATNVLTGTAAPLARIFKTLYQGGIVFKATKDVSLFYGYNENFSPNVQNNQVLPSQSGKQHEVGVKSTLLDERLTVNLAYFDIKQQNLTAPSFPQTTPPSFVLISGETSKGVDGDISWSVTKQLDLLASFAIFDAKVPATPAALAAGAPAELPAGNVSENTCGLWLRYKFTGALKGFSAGGGVSYQNKKAITDSANTTFYGWVPGRTLVDLNFAYDAGRVKYTLNVDNLLDRSYIYAARNQALIIPGTGINLKAGVTLKF